MKRSLFASASAALSLALAIGTVGAIAPAAAAPPDSDWDAAASSDVVSLSLSTLGITLADLGISTSEASAGTTLSPRASSTSANLSATVLGLGLGVVQNVETAPPTTAPSGLNLLAANALVFDLGALTSVNEANWTVDAACISDGVLSRAETQIAGIDVLSGTVDVGAARVTSTTQLAQNAGLNYGVQSVATGSIAELSLLNGAIGIDVEGTTTLTAISTGTSGSIAYDPAQVTVTLGGSQTVLEPGVALPLTVGTTQVSITLNEPPTLAASSASLDFLSISIDTLLGTDVSLGVLPMSVDANAPAGGIDCPPPAPVITQPANGATTNATPTIGGTAEPNATIEVFIDGSSVGTTTANAGGLWTLPLTTSLSEGPHTATATQSVAGQLSPTSTPVAFTVDSTAPPAPVISSPTDGALLNDTTPTITGTAEAGSTVTVSFDGSAAGTTTTDGGGNWTFTPSTPLTDGAHTVHATATDAVGNVSPNSNTVNFTIDATPPAVPVILDPVDGESFPSSPPISGTAEANSTVTVYIDGTSAGTTPADGDGNWSFGPGPLVDGTHTVYATSTDAAGNVSANSNTVNFTIDTADPAAPVIVTPIEGQVLGDSTPAITGTAEANSTVTVIIDGNPAGTTTADGDGNWTFTPGTPLADGPHVVTATATDAAGNVSPQATPVNFVIDTVDPDAPVIVTPTEGQVLNDSTPTITGTAEANSTVTVIIDGSPVGTTTADGDGDWTFTPGTPLADGPHAVTATATDAAGNVGPQATPVNFVIDATAPMAPAIVTPTEGQVLNDSTPTITGTAEANSTVTVIIDGSPVGTTTADGDGDWTFTPGTPLADGPHAVTATASDAAGNTGLEAAPVNFAIDTIEPEPPVILVPGDGASVGTTTPAISGTAEANSTVTVYIDGSSIGTTPADGLGNWTITPTTPLAPGLHTAVATATDAAANVSDLSNVVSFTVDTSGPAAPVIVTPTEGQSLGDSTPTITGTAEANSTVTVIVDGNPAGTTTADGDGNWTFTPSIPLADGPHVVTATATDAAGNTGTPAIPVNFVIDATAPAAPVIITPFNGQTLIDDTPTITGIAEANSTVTVIIDGSPVGTATTDGAGFWEFTPATPLADGPHVVTAIATDAAGNTGPQATPVNFVIDATAPAAPVIQNPSEGAVLADNTPAITGTAEAGTMVTVIIDGHAAGTTTAGGGTWIFTPGTPLADGPHVVTATATDNVGNVGPQATPVNFVVDTVAPAAPAIVTPTEGQLLNDRTPTITGTAEANSTVSVIIDGSPAGTTPADGDGNWTFTPRTPLADGPHVVTATATDAAGNTGPEATPVSFVIDATPPAAPVITAPSDGEVIDDSTPDITGTAEPGSTVTVIIDGQPVGTTTADENGDWVFTPTTPLDNGDRTITATATDAAGNTGPGAQPITVTIDVPGPPDVQFSLTPATQTVDSGSRAVLMATVRNTGESTATDVTVTIEMPAGFTDYSGVAVAWPDGTSQPPDGVVGSLTFAVGDLSPGQAVTYRIVGTVTGQPGSSMTIVGRAAQDEADAFPANNSAQARIVVGSASGLPVTGGEPLGGLLSAMLLLLLGGLALSARRRLVS